VLKVPLNPNQSINYNIDPWVDSNRIFTHIGSKHAKSSKDVPFWIPHNGRQHLGSKISSKPSKSGLNVCNVQFQAS